MQLRIVSVSIVPLYWTYDFMENSGGVYQHDTSVTLKRLIVFLTLSYCNLLLTGAMHNYVIPLVF